MNYSLIASAELVLAIKKLKFKSLILSLNPNLFCLIIEWQTWREQTNSLETLERLLAKITQLTWITQVVHSVLMKISWHIFVTSYMLSILQRIRLVFFSFMPSPSLAQVITNKMKYGTTPNIKYFVLFSVRFLFIF